MDENECDVGARIRQLRELYGFSQRELAKRAGMTHGAISQMERNQASPSVGTLRRIIDVFVISFAEFFSDDPLADSRVFYPAEEMLEVGSSDLSMKMVGRDVEGEPLQLIFQHYSPGSETSFETYSHPGDEGGVVVSGCLQVTIGAETRMLKPGDGYLFHSRLPHRFHNPGPDECVVVIAMTPSGHWPKLQRG